MNADQPAPQLPDDNAGPLKRLLAGGRHNRLLILGNPPGGLPIGETRHLERTIWLLRPGQTGLVGAGQYLAVGDPARLPFVESLFDRVVATSVLPADTVRTELRELWRIMSPAALAVLVVKARRPWHVARLGWLAADLAPLLDAAMFEIHAQRIETIPDRHHILLVGKRDGLRTVPIGTVQAAGLPATA